MMISIFSRISVFVTLSFVNSINYGCGIFFPSEQNHLRFYENVKTCMMLNIYLIIRINTNGAYITNTKCVTLIYKKVIRIMIQYDGISGCNR